MSETAQDTSTRQPTDVDRIAERYFDASVALSPITATYLGIPGHDEELDDLSPRGLAAAAALRDATLAELAAATPADDVDAVTVAAMTERLGLAQERYAAGLDEMDLNVIASPLQGIRDVFDLMPQTTEAEWRVVAVRLAAIPAALDGYRESLLVARDRGMVSPRRQVTACAEQCRDLTADDGYFSRLVAGATADEAPLAGAFADELAEAGSAAAGAYAYAARRLPRGRAAPARARGRRLRP